MGPIKIFCLSWILINFIFVRALVNPGAVVGNRWQKRRDKEHFNALKQNIQRKGIPDFVEESFHISL